MKLLKQIWQAILNALATTQAPQSKPTQPIAEVPTKVIKPEVMDRITIEQLLAIEAAKLVGAKEIGNNTDSGGRIDKVILTAGGRLGWPYCAMTVTYVVMMVCRGLGISYPKGLYRGASSQGFKNESSIQYLMSKPNVWCVFVHSNNPPDGHGHTGFVIDPATMRTFEGNFQQQINYFHKEVGYAKIYVDVVQAIIDQYNLEHKGV